MIGKFVTELFTILELLQFSNSARILMTHDRLLIGKIFSRTKVISPGVDYRIF